jgi:uncharacterized repeat protein (TIGR03803 family)
MADGYRAEQLRRAAFPASAHRLDGLADLSFGSFGSEDAMLNSVQRHVSRISIRVATAAVALAAIIFVAAFAAHSLAAPRAGSAAASSAARNTAPAPVHFKMLYTFTGGADGASPGGLTVDAQGNIYGTTAFGGAGQDVKGYGVVFELDAQTGQQTVLYTFSGGADGAVPNGGLILDAKGNLYGTTEQGGTQSDNCYFGDKGCGVVFELSPAQVQGMPWTETVLHAFTGGDDGEVPLAGLVADGKGNFYGTTMFGGTGMWQSGVVFKVDTAGNETVLYNFCSQNNEGFFCSDGALPEAGLIRDSQGNLYGTTSEGGYADYNQGEGDGVVFKLTPAGQESLLYSFSEGYPNSGLTMDAQGDFYGTTPSGGNDNGCLGRGCGIVFKLSGLTFDLLYSFNGIAPSGASDGANPGGTLLRDATGNLYGVTVQGGKGDCSSSGQLIGCGTIYRVTQSGAEKVLYSFQGASDGAFPSSGLVKGGGGIVYGSTSGDHGVAHGFGTVFEVSR